MYSDFTEHILNICQTLNSNKVQFIIVGGTAAGFHGFNRMTMDQFGLPTGKHDFDFWFNPTYENYFNILKTMKSLGKDVSRLENESSPNPKKSFLKFEFEEFKIDFLPEIKGLASFNECYSKAKKSIVNAIEFNILSIEDLIKTKETDSRPKDISDLEALRRLKDNSSE